jgi:phosphomevalonate kinase
LAFSLVEEIWKSFDTAQWPSLALVVDTQELCNAPTGLKLGLGSSAAVSVALTAALQQFAAGHGDAGTIAMEAHHRFQGGRGSGVDVAASLHGGVILYRRAGSEARQLGWPAGLCYRFLWSGQVTSTAGKLEKLIERRGQLAASDSKTMLENLAEDVAAAWSLGDGRQILEAIPAYVDIVYNPCGAGGGDIGIVLAACEHDVEEFCEQARQQNFHVLDIALDSQGVLFAESSH